MSAILGADFQGYVVPVPDDGSLGLRYASAGHPRPAVGLARALALGPPLHSSDGFALAVRQEPSPWIVLIGPRSTDTESVFESLSRALLTAADRLRLYSWPAVEEATVRLAGEIRGLVPEHELARARVVGVPRGGLVVAGLLAYALDIPGARVAPLQAARDRDELTILVDDCIISGARLREILRKVDGTDLIVASLCSHPEVRQAIEASETEVRACIAADDLKDWGTAELGEDYGEWKRIWMERVPERYGAALTDLPAFPWSEPDTRSWDEEAGRVRENWKVVPPSMCLRNRVTKPYLDLQVADDIPGIERLAPDVVPVRRSGATVLIHCARRSGVTLSRTGAELLDLWLESDSVWTSRTMAERYGVDESRIRRDLEELLASLLAKGFVQELD
jgi:hypothetical protein